MGNGICYIGEAFGGHLFMGSYGLVPGAGIIIDGACGVAVDEALEKLHYVPDVLADGAA